MRVAVVGAGAAGLAAARTLTASGHEVVVFEKSDVVGGRIATHQVGDFTFDAGATTIAPRGLAIEQVMLLELDTSDIVEVTKPIYTHAALRVSAGDPGRADTARYVYRSGIDRLPKLLAQTLDVRLSTQIDSLERAGDRYRLANEDFDGLILTPPIPQAGLLLWSMQESRPFANAHYRSCLSVMLGFAAELPATNYHALLDLEQRHPLTFLSLESTKSPCRAPEGQSALVAQMSPAYSLSHYERTDEAIVGDVVDYLVRLYGPAFETPAATKVRRWKYSQPESTALFTGVNRPGSKVLVAGDGVSAGRVERAFESGVLAARLLIGDP